MKQKISITVEKEALKELDKEVNSGRFRNRSHAFEYAVRRVMEE